MTHLCFIAVLTVAAGVLAADGADMLTAPGNHDCKIKAGGLDRTYWIHVPTGYDGKTPLPLMIILPGGNGRANYGDDFAHMIPLSDKDGFLIAYTTSSTECGAWSCYMNCDPKREPLGSMAGKVKAWADDAAYFRAVIAELEAKMAIDGKRIYMAGSSAGGLMTYRMGVLLADKLAGIAVMAGNFCWRNEYPIEEIPLPAKPVAVIAFHGDADKNVPYERGVNKNITIWSAHESTGWWVKQNGCAAAPAKETLPKERTHNVEVVVETWSGGKAPVALYTKVGGGHEWPSHANELMWEFFNKHAKE